MTRHRARLNRGDAFLLGVLTGTVLFWVLYQAMGWVR